MPRHREDTASGPGIRAPVAARVAGASYAMLDYYARTDLLLPSVADTAGRGCPRLYSLRDVVALRLVRELRDAGLSLQRVRKAIAALRACDDWPPCSRLVTDGRDAYLCDDDTLTSLLARPGQGAWRFVLDLPRVAREVAAACEAERRKAA